MTDFFKTIVSKCRALSAKKEAEIIDNQIAKLQSKKDALIGKKDVKETSESVVEAKHKHAISSNELIINVAANVAVKDIQRNIERKLKRNLNAKNEDDRQVLFDHLYKFYCIKHANTLPLVYGRNKTYEINTYVAMRTNSVINCDDAHIDFNLKQNK